MLTFNTDPEVSITAYSVQVINDTEEPATHLTVESQTAMVLASDIGSVPNNLLSSYTVYALVRVDSKPFGGFYTIEETPGSEERDVIYSDLVFPRCITYGSTGSPKYSTEKTEVDSGAEQRNQRRANVRHTYNISMENMNSEDISEIMNLWHVCAGDFIGFLFLDPMDHTSANTEDSLSGEQVAPTDQFVASAIGTQADYTLYKYYQSGLRQRKRRIRYPDLDTLRVAVNGFEIPTFEFPYNENVLRFTKPIPELTANLTRDTGGVITGADFSALEPGALVYVTGWENSAYNAPEGGNPARVVYADSTTLTLQKFDGTAYGAVALGPTSVTIKSALPPTGSEIRAGYYFYVAVRFDDGDVMEGEIQAGMRESAIATFNSIVLREIFE